MSYVSANAYSEKIRRWAEKSSFHAIPQMVSSKNYLVKLVWVCCLLGSTFLGGKTVITNLIDYFSYSVNTVIRLDRDAQVSFPTVTICRLHVCGIDSNEYTEFLNEFIQNKNRSHDSGYSEPDISHILKSFKDEFFAKFNKTVLDSISAPLSNTLTIEDDLITCEYDGNECSHHDFAYFKLDEFQKCYSFNSGRDFNGSQTDIRQVRRYGKNYGLHVELFLDVPDNCKMPLSSNYGLVLFVHNSTYTVWDETNGFELMSGYETDVAVDRTRLLKLPSPYSDCILNNGPPPSDSTDVVKNTFLVTTSYTQQSCIQLCYQNFLAEKYSCYDPSLPFINSSRTRPCFKLANSSSSIYSDKEKYAECLSSCPLECDSYTYAASLSYTEFPSQSYAELLALKKNITTELSRPINNILGDEKNLWRNGFVSLNVFYKSELMTTITERPQTELETFISELGGTLGLFLGVSFLSFVELVEIVVELIILKVERSKYLRKTRLIKVASKPNNPVPNETEA